MSQPAQNRTERCPEWTTERVAARLAAPTLGGELDRLGLRADDVADAVAVLPGLDDAEHEAIAVVATGLVARLGLVPGTAEADRAEDPFAGCPQPAGRPTGLLPLAALVLTADDVRAWHRARGITAADSDAALTDLGQQVWVHRQTFGAFGLHTHGWLAFGAWTGVLFWLGRLQFNVQRASAGHWRLSTHIPQSGPLTPESVDEALSLARAFFAAHFPDQPVVEFFCSSWLLDPQLVEVLPPASNMVRFQQRWHDVVAKSDGNADALFFVFRRRYDWDAPGGPDLQLDQLPRDTTLQRAIIDKIVAGGCWQVCRGEIPTPTVAAP